MWVYLATCAIHYAHSCGLISALQTLQLMKNQTILIGMIEERTGLNLPIKVIYLARDHSSTLHPVSPFFFFVLFHSLSSLFTLISFLIHSPVASSGPHRVIDRLFNNTRYFVIKSNNYENVDIAKDRVGPCKCVRCTQ